MSAPGPVVTKYPCALATDALSASISNATISFTEFSLAAPQAQLALKMRRHRYYAAYYLISVRKPNALAFPVSTFQFLRGLPVFNMCFTRAIVCGVRASLLNAFRSRASISSSLIVSIMSVSPPDKTSARACATVTSCGVAVPCLRNPATASSIATRAVGPGSLISWRAGGW